LTLGGWVGISGAAFTTGLGNVGGPGGTALGTSMLCGLFNVRLGYWWQNNFSQAPWIVRNCFPMHQHLKDEFLGSFHIENRDRWYLSDGGHFENTAAYELIRRQVPFIIICDCGADPGGDFADIANLTRRVRIDFGAECAFFRDDELQAFVHPDCLAPGVTWRTRNPEDGNSREEPPAIAGRIGTLSDLHPRISASGDPKRVRAHATLARVTYPEKEGGVHPTSLLLLIKPGITSDLTADLLNYQLAEPLFPHQSTLDQFFDEAQWESYRKLGSYISELLFEKREKKNSAGAKQEDWYPLADRTL